MIFRPSDFLSIVNSSPHIGNITEKPEPANVYLRISLKSHRQRKSEKNKDNLLRWLSHNWRLPVKAAVWVENEFVEKIKDKLGVNFAKFLYVGEKRG